MAALDLNVPQFSAGALWNPAVDLAVNLSRKRTQSGERPVL